MRAYSSAYYGCSEAFHKGHEDSSRIYDEEERHSRHFCVTYYDFQVCITISRPLVTSTNTRKRQQCCSCCALYGALGLWIAVQNGGISAAPSLGRWLGDPFARDLCAGQVHFPQSLACTGLALYKAWVAGQRPALFGIYVCARA